MTLMIGFVISIVVSVGLGYLAGGAVYALAVLAMHYTIRPMLLKQGRLTPMYYILFPVVWAVAAFVAAYVSFGTAPMQPWGSWIFSALAVLLLVYAIAKGHASYPHQRPLAASIGLYVMLLAGGAAGMMVHFHQLQPS